MFEARQHDDHTFYVAICGTSKIVSDYMDFDAAIDLVKAYNLDCEPRSTGHSANERTGIYLGDIRDV